MDDVAAEWLNTYKEDQLEAVADLLTFTLRCAGCDFKVTKDIVEDPDSFKDRISEIQDKYQAVGLPCLCSVMLS